MSNDSFEPSYGPQRQREVFFEALAGESDGIPLDFEELREQARDVMDPGAYGYVAGSAGREETESDNRRAFRRWKLRPRVLNDITDRSLSTELFGETLPGPVLLAPVGVQSIIHERGAAASAEGAARKGVPFVHSTVSSHTIEDVAETVDDSPLWFQLYWSSLPDLNESLIRRAEEAGYEAVVVTLDTPLMGWRPRDLENGYFPFLEGEGLANYTSDPVFRDELEVLPEESLDETIELFIDVFSNPAAEWEDLRNLAETTDLPFLVKGVLHPDDADRARDHGVDGVVVSNHGGRQVDGEIPALEALTDVVAEGPDDLRVLFDSGIRTGSDVLKAVALGADAVLLGRPYLYALAVEGADGVETILENIHAELDITMGLCGLDDLPEADRTLLTRED